MSVATIASSGIALSSARSIWRGCMNGEPCATSCDQELFSCAQSLSFALPGLLFRGDTRQAVLCVDAQFEPSIGEPIGKRLGRFPGVAYDAHRNLFDEAEHAMIGVDSNTY